LKQKSRAEKLQAFGGSIQQSPNQRLARRTCRQLVQIALNRGGGVPIRSIPIARINPAPYNPRKDLAPGDPEYRKLARSLDEFGCVEPLVWNQRTGHLVAGHQRFKILKARGQARVQVSVVSLPLAKEKVLNLALNKIASRALTRPMLPTSSPTSWGLMALAEAATAPDTFFSSPRSMTPNRTEPVFIVWGAYSQ